MRFTFSIMCLVLVVTALAAHGADDAPTPTTDPIRDQLQEATIEHATAVSKTKIPLDGPQGNAPGGS